MKKSSQVEEKEAVKFRANSSLQREAISSIKKKSITLLIGPAGTGKTLCACFASWSLLRTGEVDKIVVIRLAADSHGERIGALPGSLQEKLFFMAGPLLDNFAMFATTNEINALFNSHLFEIIPISQVRGRSFRRCAIIVEEIQNLEDSSVLTVLTRIGEGSHMVLTGDAMQVDHPGRNGVSYAKYLLDGLEDVAIIEFSYNDVVRHPLVAAILERASKPLV